MHQLLSYNQWTNDENQITYFARKKILRKPINLLKNGLEYSVHMTKA